MGKLHTLRRAIQRAPQAFMNEVPAFEQTGQTEPRFTGMQLVCSGAQFCDGHWQPVVVSDQKSLFPYRRFVRTTLRALGHEIAH
jgi:hypothetical protein